MRSSMSTARILNHVFSLCVRMTGDRTRAEELTQDVFVRAWEKLPSFRGESAFSTWLHRLTVNVVLNERRVDGRERSRNVSSDDDDESAPPAGSTSQPHARGEAGPRAGDRKAAEGRAEGVRAARRGRIHARGDRIDARCYGGWMQGAAASGAAALTGGFEAMTYDKHECDRDVRAARRIHRGRPVAGRAGGGGAAPLRVQRRAHRRWPSFARSPPRRRSCRFSPRREICGRASRRASALPSPRSAAHPPRCGARRARQWQLAMAAAALIAVSAGTTYLVDDASAATGSHR